MTQPAGLRVPDLTDRHAARTALDILGFEIAPGRFCALLGLDGAGNAS